MKKFRALVAFLLGFAVARIGVPAECASSFDVREYGAKGDGKTLDTVPMNKAIDACAAAGGGRVLIPPGKYLTGTVRLKSNITLQLDAGAEIIGSPDLNRYQNFTRPKNVPLVGGSLRWHRALILGEGIENVTITGQGIINGNNVVDPAGEEGVRGPHAVLFGNCKNISVRDISIRDSANYGLFFEFTSHVEVRGIKVTGGWDGVHVRGWKDNPCRDVSVTDCKFYTGDDCIAGWYWKDLLIDRCVLNSSSNGLRLFGPAKNVIVHSCLFFGPGRYDYRTSGLLHHNNMAAGLCLQPSAWDESEGVVDDVHISDVVMHDVGTPFHIAAQPPSTIGHVTIDRLSATGVYRAAASIESWSEKPVGRVDLRDSSIQFVGGFGPIWSDPAEAAVAYATGQSTDVTPPGKNPRPLPAWGLYARHVASLNLSDVRFDVTKNDRRPAIILDGVDAIDVDNLRWPNNGPRSLVLSDVHNITKSGPAVAFVKAECVSLAASPDGKIVTAALHCDRKGLAKIDLKLDGKTITRWAWLDAGEKVDVVFADLPKLESGRSHEMVCGSVHAEINVSTTAADGGRKR